MRLRVDELSARTPLMDAALTEKSRKQYDRGVSMFVAWLRDRSSSPKKATLFHSAQELDVTLSHYLQHVFNTSQKISLARGAVFGVEHLHPQLKGQLPRCRMSLAGWGKMKPSKPRPPMPKNVMLFLAMRFARAGRIDLCLAMLVTFDCMLRVSELTRLKREDVLIPGDARLGSAARGPILRLGRTKTGTEQSAMVEDPLTAELLAWWIANRCQRGAPLFDWGKSAAAHFRKAIHAECKRCGLSSRFTPHSMRHGGATHRHLQGEGIEEIMLKGRWQSSKTARRYIQKGRALSLLAKLPARVVKGLAIVEANSRAALRLALAQ